MNYSVKGDARSSRLSVGKLTYSLCQRDFTNREKHVQILLFDYNAAEIMYNQSIRKWNEMSGVENDTIFFQKTTRTGQSIFESYFSRNKHSQIVMGINERFFLTVSGNKIDLEELRSMVRLFDFEKFPK